MRRYEDVIKDIESNANSLLSPETSERGFLRAKGCLLAVLCEVLLDIRELMKTWR